MPSPQITPSTTVNLHVARHETIEYRTMRDTTSSTERTGLFAAGGSILAALAASACCWIPLLLIALGVSAGGVGAWFEQYRWLFLGITAVLLGAGFYFVYFRKPYCAPGSTCATPNFKLQRFSRVMLWVATVVVIATAAFPEYVGFLIPAERSGVMGAESEQVSTTSLTIEGMTCEACAVHVRNALVNVPGVLDASVSYTQGEAKISVDKTSPPSARVLEEAVERAGYKAEVMNDR